MISTKQILSVLFSLATILYAKDYTISIKIYKLGDTVVQEKLSDVTYIIRDIKGNSITEEIKLKPKKNNKYKIKYDFSLDDFEIILNCSYKDRNYQNSMELENYWFEDDYTSRDRTIDLFVKKKDLPGIDLEKNGGEYPYEFKIDLIQKRPRLKGYVYEIKNGIEYRIPDADIRFNFPNIKGMDDTDENGTFDWTVTDDAVYKKVKSPPEIYATKRNYHINSTSIDKNKYNNADVIDSLKIRLYRKEKYVVEYDCGNYSDILEYSSECDECICKNRDKIYYPKYGVCDISNCPDGTKKTWLNSKGTSLKILGDMRIECVEQIDIKKDKSNKMSFVNNNTEKLISFSIDQDLNEDVEVRYPENFNPNQKITDGDGNVISTISSDSLVGYIDKTKLLSIIDTYKTYNHSELDNRRMSLEFDIDYKRYFVLKKMKTSKPWYDFILGYNEKQYRLKVVNNQETIGGKQTKIWDLPYFNVNLSYKKDLDKFIVESITIEGDIITVDPSKNKSNYKKNKQDSKQLDDQFEEISSRNKSCNELYKKIDQSINSCKWDESRRVSKEIFDDGCNFTTDLNIMTKVMKTLFYDALNYDDDGFLKLFDIDIYRETDPTVFEKLDALYIGYDELKQLGSNTATDYSATEVCHHYYRKFRFYLMYAEFLLGGLQKIIFEGKEKQYLEDSMIEVDFKFPQIGKYDNSKSSPFFQSSYPDKKKVILHIINQAEDAFSQYKKMEKLAVKEDGYQEISIRAMEDRFKIIRNNQRYR